MHRHWSFNYKKTPRFFIKLILFTIFVIGILRITTTRRHLPDIIRKGTTTNVYLVTGGAGFIGSHLIDRLLNLNVVVILLDNFNNHYPSTIKRRNVVFLQKRHPNSELIVIEGSINDAPLLQAIFAKYDITHVAHLAALPGVRSSTSEMSRYVEINYLGTQLLLSTPSSSRRSPLFVFAPSSSVYGQTDKVPFVETDPCDRPLSPYAASKRSAELLAHVYYKLNSLNVTILRFFNIYGPRGRPDMMPFMLMQASVNSSRVIDVYDNGEMKRDWTYIDDLIDVMIITLKRPLGYEIINVGYGSAVKLSKMIQLVQSITNRPISLQYKKSYRTEPSITFCNNSKARTLLDFNPKTNVSEGLKKTWLWFQQEYGSTNK